MRRSISGMAVLVLMAGCTGGGAGVADQDSDSAFATCVERAGLSLDGAEDWSEAEEREFLAQPDALGCVVSDVPAGERADLLGHAFPDDEGTDEAADRARTAKTDALVAYVAARGAGAGPVSEVAALMDAFGWDDLDPWTGPRKQVALAMVRADDGAGDYEQWLQVTGREDDYEGRIDFIQEQEAAGTPLADEVRALADRIESAQA